MPDDDCYDCGETLDADGCCPQCSFFAARHEEYAHGPKFDGD